VDNLWNIDLKDLQQFCPKRSLITIPKGKRHLSNVRVDYMVGPNSYPNAEKLQVVAPTRKCPVIGKEERNFDPIKYSINNKVLILKGLY
jgi:hypothetical protein